MLLGMLHATTAMELKNAQVEMLQPHPMQQTLLQPKHLWRTSKTQSR